MSFKMLSTITRNRTFKYVVQRYSSSAVKETESEKVDITTVDEKPLFNDPKYTEEELSQIRLKSRLNPQHRNIILNKLPFETEMAWYHATVKYKKRMLGRYGLQSLDVKSGIFWPSKEDIEDKQEYERVAYPIELREAWKMLEEKRKTREAQIRARDEEIDRNMQKMDKWRKELEDKVAKKEEELLKAKARRERLIEEVRAHFGFKIDTKDERFKQLLEKKEKEEQKKRKAQKKEEKMKKYLEKLGATEANKPNSEPVAETNSEAKTEKKD